MIEYTDKETAEHLQQLSQKILACMNYAEDILNKTQQINSAVENQIYKAESITLEISGIAAGTKNIENNVKQCQQEIQTMHHDVVTIVSQISHHESGEYLREEFLSLSHKIAEVQIKIQQIDENLPTLNKQLNQGLIAIKQLVEQRETDKQEFDALVQQLESKLNGVLDVKAQIDQLQKLENSLEIMAVEVSTLTIDVKADRTALTSIKTEVEDLSITADNSILELRGEMEYLQQKFDQTFQQLGQKLQTQAQYQQLLRNWLFGITFSVACLGFISIFVH
ncbi:MAG: hypothetical protein HEQ35_05890 [Gloeotrichia echinulata IR180]|jgi:chromosome segregation ATPase|nr:hypothetical protein [Gloeotrichia echinulata DEX184]